MNTNVVIIHGDNPTVVHLGWTANVAIIALIIALVYFLVWQRKK
jgi:hypothetical protein